MIESLSIKNFQVHKSLEVEFDRITVFVGPSDSGKSSIMRALSWVLANKPRGKRFITHGEKTATVSIDVDGVTVKRSRGSHNTYELADASFVSFGDSVPDPIKNFLRVGDANFQRQRDADFWLSSTPSQVSKELNHIVDLTSIDTTMANISRNLRTVRTRKKVLKEQLDKARQLKEEYAWIIGANKEYRRIEAVQKEITNGRSVIARISRLVSHAKEYQSTQSQLTGAMTGARDLLSAAGSVRKVQEDIENVKNLIEELQSAKDLICQRKKELKAKQRKLDSVNACPLCLRKF